MDPSALGARLASSVVAPLVKRLFVKEGPGAGLAEKPVRVSALVSFTGEKRTLTEGDLRKIAEELVTRAVRAAGPGERPVPADEENAVADALARTLYGLGELAMDDVQAVQLGAPALAERLRQANRARLSTLPRDAELLHDALLGLACLHIVHFFTQRSTFVARTLVQQSRSLDRLVTLTDELIARNPSPRAADTAFERDYLAYLGKKHGRLTIYGIDLAHSPDRWPLDAAYMSLEATYADRAAASAEDAFDGLLDAPAPPVSPVPADHALAGHSRVLLRGVAGSGKSTLVQWLAVSCTPAGDTVAMPHLYGRIPFVLPLRTLQRAGADLPTPDRFLAAVGCPVSGAQPDGWAHRVLTSGRGLVLVDGLDEIPERERDRTRRWLRDLLDAFPHNLWMVTSRPSAVREDWLAADGFTELTLAPMSRDGVALFIGRWHAAARADAPADEDRLAAYEQSLLHAVRTKADLARLATNPLMCGLICALHRDRRGYLPHGRKELYDAALTMLLSRRDRERDMNGPDGIELSDEPQIQLLQRLAYWLIRNGRTELDRDHAERIIADALPAVPAAAAQGDAATVFRHLLLRSGLLREPAPGAVDFVHRTFQDYLGARAAVEEWDIGLLIAHAHDSQWEDVIRMAVAHGRPRERAEILRELLARADAADGADADAVRTRLRLLALACLEHASELDPAVRTAVEEGAAELLPPRSAEEARELAAAGALVLELLPGPEGLSEDEAVAVTVAASNVESERALPVLARFRDHPALQVRSQLVWAWHRFDAEQYAEEVVRHLDPDGLRFSVHNDEQLRILRRLGGRDWLDVRDGVSQEVLAAYAQEVEVTVLRIVSDHITDLRFMRDIPGLRELTLSAVPVTDLSPLCGLPLERLSLFVLPGIHDLSPLASLTNLRTLTVDLPDVSWCPDDLPKHLPLRLLRLGDSASRDWSGPFGVRAWPGLQELLLDSRACPRDAAGWAEIAALESLTWLSVDADCLADCPAGFTLPGLTSLRLYSPTGELPDLEAVVRHFPGLRTLYTTGPGNPLTATGFTPLP
ncbi:NACHT domain-containing protein [Streptomyces purpurogeneiscleroticus]|uniref:NACHT domain-containing protein n=1 Tax=Streptomyces purpurogeneiscleroticus TaxID=68259 RepID=UPI001CBB0994|nr:NACHT domain-containing protein [Streptomyces purpurogeneiscleroticus]MBZ4018189.1 ATP-binding protein [Streptomyces purpurogeneiscleroticus]